VAALTLLTRPGCGLCEDFLDELNALAAVTTLPEVSLVDVDSDPLLARRHGLDIPVAFAAGYNRRLYPTRPGARPTFPPACS